jgi:threonine dehydrogenase-like Zn-dependent dehydrogenase
MKAVAVRPRVPDSVHLAELPPPRLDDVPGGRGVLVRVLKVGVDATDREINEGKYGDAPPGHNFLVLGHESFGMVEEVGSEVHSVQPGDFVTATVRRPGSSIYDSIGTSDMTSDATYYERGINLLHGFLTEQYVDHEEFIVKVPTALKHLHVLMEPMSCAAKAVEQAFEVQRRMRVWRPRTAFVLGAGQIGLLATLVLRLRGLNVFTVARSPAPTRNSRIVEGFRAHYVSLAKTSLAQLAREVGQADLIIDATGSSAMAFGAMEALAKNGVLVWTSITGGDATCTLPSDKINLDWVLGNKLLVGSVNANRGHFESGIRDLALGDATYPNTIAQILSHPVEGLDNYQEMMRLLVQEKSALKVYVNVADG